MRIGLTGAGGIIGGAIAETLGHAGHDVITLGRRGATRPWQLGDTAPDLSGLDALVHCAFAHVPKRYRGGEGDDPEGFVAANLDGTRALFDAAAAQGVGTVLFLSSRAVFDGHAPGTVLHEDLPPAPTSLYGEVKAASEAHLATLPLRGITLRATGVYGPGRANKWGALFAEYLAGSAVAPRIGTEVHSADLAQAALLLLDAGSARGVYHASDILLDRHDLLAEVRALTGCSHPLPPRATKKPNALSCERLRALGWKPGGRARLHQTLPDLISDQTPGGQGAGRPSG